MQQTSKLQIGIYSFKRQWRGLLAAASVILMITAVFGIAEWAELATWHHGLQHVMIFVAGGAMGTAIFGNRANKESK